MMYALVLGGLILLLFSGDLLVRGSVGLACKLGAPPLIIGLTVVAFGTSAPELMISVNAALAGSPGIAVGNVVGSNIANVLLVLGVPALIYAIACNQVGIRRNTFMMIGATLLFIAFAQSGEFSRGNGIIMVILLAAFLIYSGWRAMTQNDGEEAGLDDVEGIPSKPITTAGFIGAGLIGLPLGAHLLVTGATDIARAFHVSDAVIGLTVVALGTSLPELATTVVAALRKRSDVAIGNVIGSNLFNILAIIGITAIIKPLHVAPHFIEFDLWILFGISLLLVPFAMFHLSLSRLWGVTFVLGYVIYIAAVIVSGPQDTPAAPQANIPAPDVIHAG